MAVVIHTIHGKKYAYDHHRVGKKIVCTYIAPADDIRTQEYITQRGYPMSDKDWKDAHAEANKEEKKEYGKEAFDKLQKKADKLFDKGELAGSNTPEGELIAHKSLTKDEQGQVLYHEAIESEILRDEKIERPTGAKFGTQQGLYGAKLREDRIKKAMIHRDIPGAGAEARRKAGLTAKEKFAVVMKEYDRGTLRSSSGKKVTDVSQAQAIAFSEARKIDPDYGV